MDLWDDPHSARGDLVRAVDDDGSGDGSGDGRGDGQHTPSVEPVARRPMLYLTPTTIVAPHTIATVIAVDEEMDNAGGSVWRVCARPADTTPADDCVTLRYRRAVGQGCPVRVGTLLRVPPSATR